MNISTLLFALGAALSVAFADFFLKLSANRISTNLITLIYAITATAIPTIWILIDKFNGASLTFTREGGLLGVLVGISFGLAVVFFSLTFASGANISIAVPAIRLVAIVVASALGIFILREDFTWRYALGVALTFAGIYFVVTR
ncbi:MAG: EamA family transporter [Chloroflexi bacterium]|nr:EamA family transporter [Chloroflexota bacterium]MBI3739430.1 EamA family transporter [Chloroflexota bacterium]